VIRRPDLVRAFEDREARAVPVDPEENRRVFERLWRLARELGKLPGEDPLAGIDVDIRLAEALRVLGTAPGNRARP
jgi:hypothetical protein